MDDLTILAGPILRRTEPTRTCIWLVTNQSIDITGILYQSQNSSLLEIANNHNNPQGNDHLQNNGHQQIKVSDVCFVHLIQISSIDELPTDTLLYYDLYFGDTEEGLNLNALGLVKTHYDETTEHDYLNLNGLPLPSFYIPSTLSRYLHGSCFKLHGINQDSFSKGEQRLQDSVNQPLAERPACLFLTGDQIYADDVSDAVLSQLTSFISRHLKTNEESAPWMRDIEPHLAIGERSNLFKTNPRPCFKKGEIVGYRYTKTFTSGKTDNHLVSFSEFFGMHLLCWNPNSWDANAPTPDISFHRIRRLLANTPTYMMFDDHDITDDWNIDQAWQTNIHNNDLTRRIVSNGLAAFFLCQGWGNNPDAFTPEFINTVQDYVNNIAAPTTSQSQAFEHQLWHFHHWDFAVPTSPAIIALDTRTVRRHRGKKKVSGLINNDGFRSLQQLWADVSYPKELILISPSPVLGQEFLEWIQQLMARVGKKTSVDAEFWRGDKPTFNELMLTLSDTFKLKRCIILSGDVHHSYAFKGRIKHRTGETLIQQFTCSALKNKSPAWDIIYTQKKLDSTQYGVPRQKMQGFHLKQKGKKKHDDTFGVIRTLSLAPRFKLDIEPITSNTGLAVITHNSIGEIHDAGNTISQTTHGAIGSPLTGTYTMTSD